MDLKAYARPLGFICLLAVTIYGLSQFSTGDAASVLDYWQGKLLILPIIFLLAATDVGLEAVGWIWVYSRFGIQSWDRGGVWAYLSGRAGLLLPAQLGRLIRPDAMVRLGRGSMPECLKAEAVAFVVDSTSVAALLAGLVAGLLIHPVAGVLAGAAVIIVLLFLGNQIAARLSGTRLALPQAFWWRWQTFAIILVEMAGWFAHGLAFYLVLRDLPGNVGFWESVSYAPASAVLGVGTGLPGGIGATEGFLGISMNQMDIPAAHFAVAIGAFRVLTFWIWLPIGWFALATLKRQRTTQVAPVEEVELGDAGEGVLAASD